MVLKINFNLQISVILLFSIINVFADIPDSNSSFSIIDWLIKQLGNLISVVTSFAGGKTGEIVDLDCKYKCKRFCKWI